MPCYDGRENERQVLVSDEHQARLRKEWTHNSPVAELLCHVMTRLTASPGNRFTVQDFLTGNPALARWWRDHQARDKERQGKVKKISKGSW